MNSKVKELTIIVDDIKNKFKAANISKDRAFPYKKDISKVEVNLNIFIEQASKLINKNKFLGFDFHEITEADVNEIASIYITDIQQYLTLKHDELPFNSNIAHWGQGVINDRDLFNIARGYVMRDSYRDIDRNFIPDIYKIYSVPFALRLAIENKLKKIIGFESCDITRRYGSKNITKTAQKEFPVTMIIKALKKMDCLNLPCGYSDISSIYSWASNFCHTAEKEPIWMISFAIEKLSPLFDYDGNKKNERLA
ncbi:MAG: hypothetical protein LBV14_14765, partial [Acidovorax sp.]|nr:hypothetical protein [Acidovorax sp.]